MTSRIAGLTVLYPYKNSETVYSHCQSRTTETLGRMRELGRYRLLERINRGGMADVFLSLVPAGDGRGRTVAVKLLRMDVSEYAQLIPMFMDEAKLSVGLKHPNIARAYEFGRVDGRHFIAMEFVAGQDMRVVLDRLKVHSGVIPQGMAASVMADVCEGLHYAHTRQDPMGQPLGVVHRDVSPQNVILGYDGRVRLIDFGIAKATSHVTQTQVGVLRGKYAYMSPEQVLGENVGVASDVFSSGVVLFELLTGRRLFTGKSDFSILERIRSGIVEAPSAVMPSVNPLLEKIVLKAVSREPQDRFPSALHMARALQEALPSLAENGDIPSRSAWISGLFTAEQKQLENVTTKATELAEHMAVLQNEQSQNKTGRMQTRPVISVMPHIERSSGPLLPDAWLIGLAGVFAFAMLGLSFWFGFDEPQLDEGSLVVTTSPTGAEVSVNGEFRGVTPYSSKFPEGLHELVVEHPTFVRVEQVVQVNGNDLVNLNLKLRRAQEEAPPSPPVPIP